MAGDPSLTQTQDQEKDLESFRAAGDLSDFFVSEFVVAKEWGRSVKELATLRNAFLREKIHFAYRKFQMHYSQRGLEELKKHLSPLPVEPPTPRYEGSLPPGSPPQEGVVTVRRCWSNPRLMQVEDHLGNRFPMRCRMNSKFRRGMKINLATQATWHPETRPTLNNGWWEFSGRPPRFPGRW